MKFSEIMIVKRISLMALSLSVVSVFGVTGCAEDVKSKSNGSVRSSEPATAGSSPKIGDQAKDFELLALTGERCSLSELTKTNRVVLVVLRGYPGYQCPMCTAQFAGYLEKSGDLKSAGVHVVFIYPGPSEGLTGKGNEFAKDRELPSHFHFLLDPDYKFVNSYGLRWDAANETAYPSTFIIEKDRKITFAKVSSGHGDRVSAAEVLKTLNAK